MPMVKQILSKAVIAAIITSALMLCGCSDSQTQDNSQDELISPNCTHDESYIEPQVKTGRYYLNGDTSSYYFEVTEETIELCGIDLGELFDSWQNADPEGYVVSEETAKQREDVKNDWIEKWSGKLPYHVETLHRINDMPTIVTKETVTPDGFILGSGLTIKDENTLTGFGKDGDFILTEN